MPERKLSFLPVRAFLPAAVIMALLGFGGMVLVMTQTSPNGGTRWLFYFTAVLGFSGAALPLMAFLNRRFPSDPAPTPGVIVRQAMWPALYIVTLLRFSAAGVRSLPLALLLLAGLILIEWLLRLTERSQWRPGRATPEPDSGPVTEHPSDPQ